MVTLALSLNLQANHSDTNIAMDSKLEEDYTNQCCSFVCPSTYLSIHPSIYPEWTIAPSTYYCQDSKKAHTVQARWGLHYRINGKW